MGLRQRETLRGTVGYCIGANKGVTVRSPWLVMFFDLIRCALRVADCCCIAASLTALNPEGRVSSNRDHSAYRDIVQLIAVVVVLDLGGLRPCTRIIGALLFACIIILMHRLVTAA